MSSLLVFNSFVAQATGEAFSPQKRMHPTHQNMKFPNFFLFLQVIFALLDPDPKHCFWKMAYQANILDFLFFFATKLFSSRFQHLSAGPVDFHLKKEFKKSQITVLLKRFLFHHKLNHNSMSHYSYWSLPCCKCSRTHSEQTT